MKTDKQFIDEIYKKYDEYQKEEKIKRQKVMKRIINIAAVFVVALSSVVVFSQKKTPKVLQEMKKEDVAKIDLETVGNFENFYNIIKSKNSTNGETKYSFNSSILLQLISYPYMFSLTAKYIFSSIILDIDVI